MNIKIIVSTLWCKKYYVPTVYIVIIGENVDYIYKYAFVLVPAAFITITINFRPLFGKTTICTYFRFFFYPDSH